MERWILALVAIVLATAAFALAVLTVRAIYLGAVIFFVWALAHGFIGIAVFAACWFLMLPLTLIACAVVGFGVKWAAREQARLAREMPLTRQRLGLHEPTPQMASRASMIREPADVWKGYIK